MLVWRYELDSDTWYYEPSSPGLIVASVFVDEYGWHASMTGKAGPLLGPYTNRIEAQEEAERYLSERSVATYGR